ncbi:Erg1 squalene epoxidase [Candida orthopsilosis Co 90-125]|uniref:Erg1 squalene epoxidase n=1 Tax=Candida orthopsilosis (strain 90-125) TaxID=1136231 RepID=H8WX61_CANO9|nr:Erg1 squalene epoxidase [Candida orthopsilosis Co 90-125]CCG21366.1 Erg1 squalene epoxidase [Candida orthopsilosis Co 90-125]
MRHKSRCIKCSGMYIPRHFSRKDLKDSYLDPSTTVEETFQQKLVNLAQEKQARDTFLSGSITKMRTMVVQLVDVGKGFAGMVDHSAEMGKVLIEMSKVLDEMSREIAGMSEELAGMVEKSTGKAEESAGKIEKFAGITQRMKAAIKELDQVVIPVTEPIVAAQSDVNNSTWRDRSKNNKRGKK